MIDLKILMFQANETFDGNSDTSEIGIVILTGKCAVSADLGKYTWSCLGSRNSVFENTPDTVYIPCHTKYSIQAIDSNLKIAVISTEANHQYVPFVVRSDEVSAEIRGEREWKRSVYHIITTKHQVDSLIIGETIHTDGVWSGYPPHKHDTDDENNESKNNEVYYVEIEPKDAVAIFLQYGERWEKPTILRSGDSIHVKEGYHAVVSAGGSQFYYLWALDSRDHRFICKFDTNYSWIK